MKTLGAKYITSVNFWDVRRQERHGSISNSKNLNKKLKEIYTRNPKLNKIVVIVGRRGRSQHSATELNIFSYTSKCWERECEMGNQSNSNLWDLFLREEFN